MKDYILISKRWHNPQIKITLHSQKDVLKSEGEVSAKEGGKMEIKMELEDFLKALCETLGNPTFMFTKAKIKEKVFEASHDILREMKHKSIEVN